MPIATLKKPLTTLFSSSQVES